MQNHRNALLFVIAGTVLVLSAFIGTLLIWQHNRADQLSQRQALLSSSPPTGASATLSQSSVTHVATPVAMPTPTPTHIVARPVLTPTPALPPGSHVIFSDSFSGSSLSSAWTKVTRHGEYAQSETECNVPGAVSVANHLLTITTTRPAQPATCGDFNLDGSVRHPPSPWPYTTGDVQWKSFAFTYGTITYRAKFPAFDTSTWPAIWLLGSNCQATNVVTADTGYDTCPDLSQSAYVEMDLTECYTSAWCQLALFQYGKGFVTCGYPLDSNWHTFTFRWTPTAISLSMDGQSTGCSYSAADGYSIPSTPMFLLIQTQTGGIGGTPNDSTLPATLQVSSVTVTQP